MNNRSPKSKAQKFNSPRPATPTQKNGPTQSSSPKPFTLQDRVDSLFNHAPTVPTQATPGSAFTSDTRDIRDASPFQFPVPLSQMASPLIPTPWPIAGLLPIGLCLLAAKPHADVRLLTMQLALSIACDTPAFGHFSPHPGRVLYFGFDDPLSSILPAMQHLLPDDTLPERLSWCDSWLSWDKEGMQSLTLWLDGHPETRLLVIDSLSQLFPLDKPFGTQRQRDLLCQLNHLAHQRHLTILLLHPLGRSLRADPFDTIACHPLLLDTIETLAVLDHDRGNSHATLHLSGKHMQTHALELSLQEDEGSWLLNPSSVFDSLSPQRAAVLAILAETGHPLALADISTLLNKELSATRRLLFSMVRACLISQLADGRFTPVLPYITIPKTPATPAPNFSQPTAHNSATKNTESSVTPPTSTPFPGGSNLLSSARNTPGNTPHQPAQSDTLQQLPSDDLHSSPATTIHEFDRVN